MKPHVICHMAASVDGKTLLSRWKPEGRVAAGLFERLHDELDGDSWLVGRVTGQEFAKGSAYSASASGGFHRHAWFARRDAKAYGVVLDAKGKIAWGRADIGGDPIVVVLTEQVADAHLAGLRSEGVSYFFAGRTDLDLGLTLEILNRELGVKRLILEGGGVSNGAFLGAGLVDEISLILCPAIDGAKGAPSIFDSVEEIAGRSTPVRSMTLESHQILEGGAIWLRYKLQNSRRLVMREWNKDELHKIAEADDCTFRHSGKTGRATARRPGYGRSRSTALSTFAATMDKTPGGAGPRRGRRPDVSSPPGSQRK